MENFGKLSEMVNNNQIKKLMILREKLESSKQGQVLYSKSIMEKVHPEPLKSKSLYKTHILFNQLL